MTKKEAAIVSAFTGILCGSFDDMHKYIEKIMCRPVYTHELSFKSVVEEIKTKSRDDFLLICKNIID